MGDIIKFLADPAFYATAGGILVVLRLAGEGLEAIGNLNKKKDWFDSAGSFVLKSVKTIGRILNFFGFGSKQRK